MRAAAWGILLLLLLLPGCTGWTSGSYVSVSPHMEAYAQTNPVDTVTAGDYQELVSALTGLVEEHVEEASVDVSRYGENLETDLDRAVAEVLWEDPLAAYAVEDMVVQAAEVGARRMASVTIAYSRTQEQIRQIQPVWGQDGVRQKVARALDEAEPGVTLRVSSYRPLDIAGYVRQYYAQHLDTIMECPEVEVSVYPETGSARILEISFTYTTAQATLLNMGREVQIMLTSAAGYVRGQSSQQAVAERLYSFLRPLYTEEGTTATPVFSLLCQGIGDSQSLAQVYGLLCSQVGVESQVVSGTRDGEPWYWNILLLDGLYCHVDLLADWDGGALRMRFDGEMAGYQWDTAAYPSCPEPQIPDNPPVETEPVETTRPTEEATGPAETQPPPEESAPPPETETQPEVSLYKPGAVWVY